MIFLQQQQQQVLLLLLLLLRPFGRYAAVDRQQQWMLQ